MQTIKHFLDNVLTWTVHRQAKIHNALGETCNSILFQEQMYTHNKQTKQENLRITLNLYLYVPLTHQLRCKYIAAALVTLHGGLKAKDTLTQQNEELLSRPM